MKSDASSRCFFTPAGIDEPAEACCRPTMSAVKSDAKIPSVSEIAKPLDRAACLPEQNDRGDQRRDVGVKDRTERFLVSGLYRDLERFAKGEFFAQALVNQNVRIDRRPIVKIMPAMPGNVRTKRNMVSAPTSNMRLMISARYATRPGKLIVDAPRIPA